MSFEVAFFKSSSLLADDKEASTVFRVLTSSIRNVSVPVIGKKTVSERVRIFVLFFVC